MSDSFNEAAFQKTPKAEWVKPVVRQLRAGAAELGPDSNLDDADPGGALDNS
jgi:hypothetical protein